MPVTQRRLYALSAPRGQWKECKSSRFAGHRERGTLTCCDVYTALKIRRFLAPGKVRSLKQTVHWLIFMIMDLSNQSVLSYFRHGYQWRAAKFNYTSVQWDSWVKGSPSNLIKMEDSLPSHAQQVPTVPESEKACSTVWRHQSSSSTLTWSVHSHTWHSTSCM